MSCKPVAYPILLSAAVGWLMLTSLARAEAFEMGTPNSVSSVPMESLAATTDQMLLATSLNRGNLYGANLYSANLYSANLYGASLTTLLGDEPSLAYENGVDLTQAMLSKREHLKTDFLANENKPQQLKLNSSKPLTGEIAERLAAIEQQRAGFSLSGLFRSREDHSLVSIFFVLAFFGILIAGVRLEMLRRKAEQAAFYGSELASHRRRTRNRSTVVYVQTPSRSSGSSRRHGSSSQSRRRHSHGQRSHEHDHSRRSHTSTHPVTIDSRLAS